jgi:hypothetical protein
MLTFYLPIEGGAITHNTLLNAHIIPINIIHNIVYELGQIPSKDENQSSLKFHILYVLLLLLLLQGIFIAHYITIQLL